MYKALLNKKHKFFKCMVEVNTEQLSSSPVSDSSVVRSVKLSFKDREFMCSIPFPQSIFEEELRLFFRKKMQSFLDSFVLMDLDNLTFLFPWIKDLTQRKAEFMHYVYLKDMAPIQHVLKKRDDFPFFFGCLLALFGEGLCRNIPTSEIGSERMLRSFFSAYLLDLIQRKTQELKNSFNQFLVPALIDQNFWFMNTIQQMQYNAGSVLENQEFLWKKFQQLIIDNKFLLESQEKFGLFKDEFVNMPLSNYDIPVYERMEVCKEFLDTFDKEYQMFHDSVSSRISLIRSEISDVPVGK